MPNPTPGDVHVNGPLTNVSIAFMQKSTGFVADRVFPNVPVKKQSDVYFEYDRGDFNRDEAEVRAPGTESAGGGFNISTSPYFAKVYAFHKDIDDAVRANADAGINADRDAVNYTTLKCMIKREKIWVDSYFKGGVWTGDDDGVSASPGSNEVLQWNDAASTPIEDVRDARTTVLQSTGFEPNTLVLGREVWDQLRDHPDIIDRVKAGQTPNGPAIGLLQSLAIIMELDRILIMTSIENTAKEGQAAVHAFIGGKKALLVYAAPSAGLMTPSAGYTFSWTGFLGAGSAGNRIKKFRIEPIESDRVECQMAFDTKLVSADLGFFWDSIVA